MIFLFLVFQIATLTDNSLQVNTEKKKKAEV